MKFCSQPPNFEINNLPNQVSNKYYLNIFHLNVNGLENKMDLITNF